MIKTKLVAALGLVLCLAACESIDPVEQSPTLSNHQIPSVSEINAAIGRVIADGEAFNWNKQSDKIIYGALMASDQVLTIKYHPYGSTNSTADFNPSNAEWSQAREKILVDLLNFSTENQILMPEKYVMKITSFMPFMDIKVTDPRVLSFLRKHELVAGTDIENYDQLLKDKNAEVIRLNEYLEDPCGTGVGYETGDCETVGGGGGGSAIVQCTGAPLSTKVEAGDLNVGCGNADPGWVSSLDYSMIPSGTGTGQSAKSWVLNNINMTDYAWTRGNAGAGVWVALIDTGISPEQCKLSATGDFSGGGSVSTRRIEKYGTYDYTSEDDCGHGTNMAGLIAAPRNEDGMPVGAAYNCNLISIRGNEDAWINTSYQKDKVANAIKMAANDSRVKIISMSMGSTFWNLKVETAIKEAYSKGKLIFVAAGSSPDDIDLGLLGSLDLSETHNWVYFPSTMDEVVSVTGRKGGAGNNPCNYCHYGPEVDFSVVMQRSFATDNDRVVPTLAFYGDNMTYSGGSSAATAITAGAAAVIWGAHPNESREQILQRMINSAENQDHSNPNFGYGNYNVDVAIR